MTRGGLAARFPPSDRCMTNDEAMAAATEKQRSHPDAKWIAVERDGQWTIARIDVPPSTIDASAIAIKPPPEAPRDDPHSQVEEVARMYGFGG